MSEEKAVAAKQIADYFRTMADAIERNAQSTFGGAFVVVPPTDGGEVLQTLILDNRQDPAQFWIFLETKSKTEVAMVDQRARTGQAFGRGR